MIFTEYEEAINECLTDLYNLFEDNEEIFYDLELPKEKTDEIRVECFLNHFLEPITTKWVNGEPIQFKENRLYEMIEEMIVTISLFSLREKGLIIDLEDNDQWVLTEKGLRAKSK